MSAERGERSAEKGARRSMTGRTGFLYGLATGSAVATWTFTILGWVLR